MAVGGLAACGDDGGDETADQTSEPTESDRVLVLMADSASSLVVGEPARLPLGVGDSDGALIEDPPATLTFSIEDADGNVVETGIEVGQRGAGLPRSYYPLAFTPAAVGSYIARTEVDGEPVDAAFT
ncbi:MAG TPA: hypothetical protein VK507_24775, partial [Iamia sp.]|nr:hypothetical protein [Iamia sp.]